jgi:hypothetical protein
MLGGAEIPGDDTAVAIAAAEDVGLAGAACDADVHPTDAKPVNATVMAASAPTARQCFRIDPIFFSSFRGPALLAEHD